MKPRMIRQGDVMLKRVNKPKRLKGIAGNAIPENAVIRSGSRLQKVLAVAKNMVSPKFVLLAEGEETGHNHVLVADLETEAEVRLYIGEDGKMYVEVEDEAVLEHPEHLDIPIQSGFWEVKRQREYDPEEERRQRFVND